ncbi:MAG: hypothetical protein WBM11_09165 [Terriglobales bacterium]
MFLLTSSSAGQTPSDVTTQHNDTYRTGWQQNESLLSPSTVSQHTFGLLWQYQVDGAVFAQPLAYHANSDTTVGSGTTTCSGCDVVFIADEQDNVYAYEADPSSQELLWEASLGSDWICAADDNPPPCGQGVIQPVMGVTSTPVIDEANKIIYVVAVENVSGTPDYYLTALNLLTGAQLASTQITPSSPGVSPDYTGNCETTATGSGNIVFDPTLEIQRAGLLLLPNTESGYGTVYVSFAPADSEWRNGWLVGYQYSPGSGGGLLSQTYVLNTTPYGTGGGIWEGGGGLVAADATVGGVTNTYIFPATGNGTFDYDTPRVNYGDTLFRLNQDLTISDHFTPADEFTYSGSNGTGRCPNDIDLDSGGVIALPDEVPPFLTDHPHLMVAADKEAKLYVVDRDSLTGYHPSGDLIVQEIQTPLITDYPNVRGYWSYPAYYKWTDAQGTHLALYYSVREQATDKAPLPINQYTLLSTGGPIPTSFNQYDRVLLRLRGCTLGLVRRRLRTSITQETAALPARPPRMNPEPTTETSRCTPTTRPT